jgi:DNA gyrase subunit A
LSSGATSFGGGRSSSSKGGGPLSHPRGLKIALDQLDAVIALIRARRRFLRRARADDDLRLSQLQAQAILDMQLQRLTGLERQKILDELAELLKTIERLRAILGSERC